MRNYDIADLSLAKEGRKKILWSERRMPVLTEIKDSFSKNKPLNGVKISACLHVTSETANLMRTLNRGGAEVTLCASNPLSTQDDVAASLVKDYGISVYALHGEDKETYYKHIKDALQIKPHITMDDGADLVNTLHSADDFKEVEVIGGTEETTTGVIRLKAMAGDGVLRYPIIAVNDARTKHFFDNRYGTGQSTIDGILRATNVLLAGSVFVVCGYGWCGRGIAMRARGMGARTIVTEVDPIKALEAVMDGFEVMTVDKASRIGDIFVTATGNKSVLTNRHFKNMKDGVILANAGHFNVEINVDALRKMSVREEKVRPSVSAYTLNENKKIFLLADGRLVNLSAAEGHPADVMDMSFSNQALSVKYIIAGGKSLEKKVYNVPETIDKKVASLKLKTMGLEIDRLTDEQKKYLQSYSFGT